MSIAYVSFQLCNEWGKGFAEEMQTFKMLIKLWGRHVYSERLHKGNGMDFRNCSLRSFLSTEPQLCHNELIWSVNQQKKKENIS